MQMLSALAITLSLLLLNGVVKVSLPSPAAGSAPRLARQQALDHRMTVCPPFSALYASMLLSGHGSNCGSAPLSLCPS